MNLLAIDASTEACSVAVQCNNKVYQRFEVCPQSHSLRLLPLVDEVLKEAGCTLQELSGIVFGQGPGSFTGVRIGIGVAQGLGFSAELPLIGVSTMQAMAQQAYIDFGHKNVIAMIDARMSEVYLGYYVLNSEQLMQAKSPETVESPDHIKINLSAFLPNNPTELYAVGTGWNTYPALLSELAMVNKSVDILFPKAEAMLALGQAAFMRGEGVSAELAAPSYVRDTVSWQKLPGRA